MEIQTTASTLNKTFSTTRSGPQDEGLLNSYGIGAANQPRVELSPQARMLQQTEQEQPKLQYNGRKQDSDDEEQNTAEVPADFVRVSSSQGSSAQSNNLSSEKATELYRSIEKML